jgi:hypothetical protein
LRELMMEKLVQSVKLKSLSERKPVGSGMRYLECFIKM